MRIKQAIAHTLQNKLHNHFCIQRMTHTHAHTQIHTHKSTIWIRFSWIDHECDNLWEHVFPFFVVRFVQLLCIQNLYLYLWLWLYRCLFRSLLTRMDKKRRFSAEKSIFSKQCFPFVLWNEGNFLQIVLICQFASGNRAFNSKFIQ